MNDDRWKEERIRQLRAELEVERKYERIRVGHEHRKEHVSRMIEAGLLESDDILLCKLPNKLRDGHTR